MGHKYMQYKSWKRLQVEPTAIHNIQQLISNIGLLN